MGLVRDERGQTTLEWIVLSTMAAGGAGWSFGVGIAAGIVFLLAATIGSVAVRSRRPSRRTSSRQPLGSPLQSP